MANRIPRIPSDRAMCDPKHYIYKTTARIREVLGVTDKMPKNFHGMFDVDGRRVKVYRSGESPSKLHRIYIETSSGKMIPSGRLVQAVCGRYGIKYRPRKPLSGPRKRRR